jgi:hypothetical protein
VENEYIVCARKPELNSIKFRNTLLIWIWGDSVGLRKRRRTELKTKNTFCKVLSGSVRVQIGDPSQSDNIGNKKKQVFLHEHGIHQCVFAFV